MHPLKPPSLDYPDWWMLPLYPLEKKLVAAKKGCLWRHWDLPRHSPSPPPRHLAAVTESGKLWFTAFLRPSLTAQTRKSSPARSKYLSKRKGRKNGQKVKEDMSVARLAARLLKPLGLPPSSSLLVSGWFWKNLESLIIPKAWSCLDPRASYISTVDHLPKYNVYSMGYLARCYYV